MASCCLSYKDTILKANHSQVQQSTYVAMAVAYPTKILFWKRITAHAVQAYGIERLLLILQRYYFESESQRGWSAIYIRTCCCLSYKDTILKANHSGLQKTALRTIAVAYPTKILFWKRITAGVNAINAVLLLLLILQRYYFESESQHKLLHRGLLQSCCLSYKDTILKANHSNQWIVSCLHHAVAYPTKILFWKRITAHQVFMVSKDLLLLILQRYYFESESQQDSTQTAGALSCCLSYKDTILKANHSRNCYNSVTGCAVAYPTKILFWKRITARTPQHSDR